MSFWRRLRGLWLCLIWATGCHQEWQNLKGVNAVVDVSSLEQPMARFDGTVMFHSGRTRDEVQAQATADDGQLVTIPHSWERPAGYGTYHFKIKGGVPEGLTMAMGVPFSAYRLTLIAGEKRFEQSQGQFGRDKDSCVPIMQEALVFLPQVTGKDADLWLEVCNFQNIKAGLRKPIFFGQSAAVSSWFYRADAPKLVTLGTFFIIALYFATMLVLGNSRAESIIFLLVCLGGATRIICTNSYLENILFFLDPRLVFEIRYKLEYSVFVVPSCGFLAITHIYFPSRAGRLLLYVSIISIAPVATLTILTPYTFWGKFAAYYQVHLMLFTMLGVVLNFAATLRRESYSFLNLLATLLPAVSVPYDIMLSLGWVKGGGYAFDYFFACFLMIHTVIFVVRYKNMSLSSLHGYEQLTKIVFPHQIAGIKEGLNLEETMPTTPGEACVMSFDIIGSSRIQHEKAKEFFRSVFRRCNEIMMEGYDGESLRANAYRIKEMGDGFLCSVGYPFASPTGFMANDAVRLARRFYEVLQEESKLLQPQDPICCGIGIALDNVVGFFPDSGTKEYDLYGRAVILATRYEEMRKRLLSAQQPRSILIIQERVYLSLDREMRDEFVTVSLAEAGLGIRDDHTAARLYYTFLGTAARDEKSGPALAISV